MVSIQCALWLFKSRAPLPLYLSSCVDFLLGISLERQLGILMNKATSLQALHLIDKASLGLFILISLPDPLACILVRNHGFVSVQHIK